MNAKITCEEVLAVLYEFLDSQVDVETSEIIREHLDDCRECFSRAEFEKLLRRRVAETGTTEEVPEDVEDRILSIMKRF